MADILRQVDEDLRKDRLLRIWRLYGIYIAGFVIVFLIAIASYQYYLFSTQSKNEAIVEKYINAISSTDKSVSIDQLIELDESSNSYIKGLAKLKRVDLYVSSEKNELAIKLLMNIFADTSLDSMLRDLALYKYLMLQLNTLDEDQYFELIRDEHLNQSRFKFLFKELKALKFLIEGDRISSLEIFESLISNPDTPIEVRTRSEKFKKISKK